MTWLAVKSAALAVFAMFTLPGPVAAATIGFDKGVSNKGEAYIEAGFLFDSIRIVNGNCLFESCAALKNNERITMTRPDGGLFDLTEIAFTLLGKAKEVIRARDKTKENRDGNVLTLTTDQAASVSFSAADFKHNEDHVATLDPKLFAGLRAVTFSTGAGGNVRLDSFYAAGLSAQAPAVPLPASLWLLLGALGGLGALSARSRRVERLIAGRTARR